MLFSALLMAILIVRMVGYHYTVSDRQQQMFRFMLKASDITKKLISSSECLSLESFRFRNVIDRERLDEFAKNFSDHEPLCAYDYDLGWRATVTEKSFTYVSPAVITTLAFGPGDLVNASDLVILSPIAMNVSITNATDTFMAEVDGQATVWAQGLVNFSAPSRVWALSRNYSPGIPRDAAPVALIGPPICSDDLDEFPVDVHSNADPSRVFGRLDEYQALIFSNSSGYMFLQEHRSDWVEFLRDGKGIVVIDSSFGFWNALFSQNPLSLGFHSSCEVPELSDDCNPESGIYLNTTVPDDLSFVIDRVRGKTPGDAVSNYGLRFETLVDDKLWLLSQFNNTRVKVFDRSDGDDFADYRLGAGQGVYVSGFDADQVGIEASRPVWAIAGDNGGYAWVEGTSLMFPSFGSFAVLAPESSTIVIAGTDAGEYQGGVDFPSQSFTLPKGGMFKVDKTHESGFRWISLNATHPVVVETWSDHGMIQREASPDGEGYQVVTAKAGNITVCAGDMAVSFGDETYLSGSCSRVDQESDSYRFVSDAPFLVIQSLGGDEASHVLEPSASDDEEASAIADRVGADILEADSVTGSYNLFYVYRASYPLALPASRKGVVLLYNSADVFSQFGVPAKPVWSGCTNWTINDGLSLFSSPNNITEAYLEAHPFQGCTFFHTFDTDVGFAVSPDHGLERVVDLAFPAGDPVLSVSLKPYRAGQLEFLDNLGRLVADNIFSSETSYSWEFGSSSESVGPSRRQEITLRVPVAIYYNESKIKPGEVELNVFDGELESFRGMIERACVEDLTEVQEARVSAPFYFEEGSLCQSGSCKRLLCNRTVSVDLNPGFRIIKVVSNETGVYIG